jgi:hypothetical protein
MKKEITEPISLDESKRKLRFLESVRGPDNDFSKAKQGCALKVNPRQVQIAKQVQTESPAAFKKVKDGKMSLNKAHEKKHPRKPKSEPKPLPPGGLCADAIRARRGETLPNPVIPQGVPIDYTALIDAPPNPHPISTVEFQKYLDALESRIPVECDHAKFGVIANKFAERQMNFGRQKPSSVY